MPKILGMEPEQYKPLLLVGGGALVFFLVLRRSGAAGSAVAAGPPTEGVPSLGVSAGPAATELSQGAQQANALQLQEQQYALSHQQAIDALDLQAKQIQLGAIGAQSHAAETYYNAVANAPIMCPKGQLKKMPDGTPYCRQSAGGFRPLTMVKDAGQKLAQNWLNYGVAQYSPPALPGKTLPGPTKF